MSGPGGMDEPHDLNRDELLAINVPALLAAGISDGAGRMRGEVQGTAQAAACVQLLAADVPLDLLGRIVTMVNRHTWRAAVEDIAVIVEEPDKRGFPGVSGMVRAGIAACRDGDEYVHFARWLADVYGLAAIGAAAARSAPG